MACPQRPVTSGSTYATQDIESAGSNPESSVADRLKQPPFYFTSSSLRHLATRMLRLSVIVPCAHHHQRYQEGAAVGAAASVVVMSVELA